MNTKGYTEIPVPPLPAEHIEAHAYTKGDLKIIVCRDIYKNLGLRWHLSISCRHRYPVWDEIRDARYALVPDDVTMAMLLPPKGEYVNLHPNCFHLHEIIE